MFGPANQNKIARAETHPGTTSHTDKSRPPEGLTLPVI
jgi:hypothetical protein